MEKTDELLRNVRKWSKEYDTRVKNAGFDFNIFSVMRKESDEVYLHSAFIAELLNPKGAHNMGVLFLEKFIAQIKYTFDTNGVHVCFEKYIGEIPDDAETGGRLDIYIANSNKQTIIIENKIYATDQNKQLIRYYNFNNKAKLYYLTLNGTPPTDSKSITGNNITLIEGEHFTCISYSNDIIDWLEECRKYIPTNSIFSATFTQYLNTIKKLTSKPLLPDMDEKIQQLVKDNLEQSLEIENALKSVKIQIQQQFWLSLVDECKRNNLRIDNEQTFLNDIHNLVSVFYSQSRKKYYGISILVGKLPTGELVRYEIRVDESIYMGFVFEKNGETKISSNYSNYSSQLKKYDDKFVPSSTFIGWRHTDPRLDFAYFSTETRQIADANEMKKVVEDIRKKAMLDIEFAKREWKVK